ncbi:DUF6600 domain-containing protein [Acanthopleuribacter pedis]|uniref:FecR protein domain-containing protein n=1 Tax=Acanthopleuribacter pedis TaxID=442870 RepID=A0A8J7U4S5_9BACT|nr:DUF6600 domain-containing protein [Acanthopleuribacter pedis]MBO1320957.1 hypothetical protein [Acanthopleuribacter pedis]
MRHTVFLLLISLSMTAWAGNYPPQEEFVDDVTQEDTTQGENLARLTFVGKDVNLVHEDGYEEKAVRNLSIVAGDALTTGRRDFAEVEFIDGSLLQLDHEALIEFQAVNEVYREESLTVIKVHRGSVFLHVNDDEHSQSKQVFRIDTKDGSSYIEGPGIYRIDQQGQRTTLKVYRGYAELSGEEDSEVVYSGEYASIRDLYAPSNARSFNTFSSDRFARWAYDRRPWRRNSAAKYVQPHLVYYARDLDGHGDWRYLPEIDDYVWCPTVATSWRPYYNGYWTRRHGRLTWVSYDTFGYVTHHYGRWSWSVDFGWYWKPGRYYSPAWVAFNSYDNYIGWCPLGYTNRPYYYTSIGFNINIYKRHSFNWHYVHTDQFFYRGHRRAYVRNLPRYDRRVITTRHIYVERDDFRSPTRLTRAIRQPTINRDRATRVAVNRGSIRVNRGEAVRVNRGPSRSVVSRSTVNINSRDTGTRAVSRYTRQVDSGSRRGNIVRRERGNVEIKRTTRTTVDRGGSSVTTTGRRTVDDGNRTTVNRSRTTTGNGTSVNRSRTTTGNGTSVNRSRTTTRENGGTSVNRSRTTTRENGGTSVNRSRTTTRENGGTSVNRSRTTTRENGGTSVNRSRTTTRENGGTSVNRSRTTTRENEGPSANRSQPTTRENGGTSINRSRTTSKGNERASSGIRRTYRNDNDSRIQQRERGSRAIPNPYRPGSRTTNTSRSTDTTRSTNTRSSERSSATRPQTSSRSTAQRNTSRSVNRSRNSSSPAASNSRTTTQRNRSATAQRNTGNSNRSQSATRSRSTSTNRSQATRSAPSRQRTVQRSQPTQVQRPSNSTATRSNRQPSRSTNTRATSSRDRGSVRSNNASSGAGQRAPVRRNQ